MKIALISDIHANQEALEKVLRDIEKQGAEKIHFLGDAVGYGCNPNECVGLIKKHCDIKILGNHDYAALGLESAETFNKAARASLEWTQNALTQKSMEILADFEMSAEFLNYKLVHATPDQPDEWKYIFSVDHAIEQFDCFSQVACFLGHSHMPVMFIQHKSGEVTAHFKTKHEMTDDKKYIINVGSVGQPRDKDSRACYMLVDAVHGTLEYRRVEYDIKKTQQKMTKAQLPEFLIERLAVGA
jgi:predicted phosphodiesterase